MDKFKSGVWILKQGTVGDGNWNISTQQIFLHGVPIKYIPCTSHLLLLASSRRWKVSFFPFCCFFIVKNKVTRAGTAVYQCELLLATAVSSILLLPDQCEIHQRSIHSCNVREVILPQKFISPSPSCYFKPRLISAIPSLLWIIRGHPQAM